MKHFEDARLARQEEVRHAGVANDREFLDTLGGYEQHAWHEARKTADPTHLNPYKAKDWRAAK